MKRLPSQVSPCRPTARSGRPPSLLVAGAGLLALLAVDLAPTASEAGEMRSFRRIYTPNSGLSGGATTIPDDLPDIKGVPDIVPRSRVEQAVRDIVSRWNTSSFSGILSPDFRGLNRLLDTLSQVPDDATLHLVSVRGVQPVSRVVTKLNDEGTEILVRDRVSAEVEVRVEYSESGGRTSTEGVNELIIDIEQRYRR